MMLNRNRVYLCFMCFLPVLVTFLKPVFISACLMSGGMCLCWRAGGGVSLGSITLARILFCGRVRSDCLITRAFPSGIWFIIFSYRVFCDSVVFPMSISLYCGFLGFIFGFSFFVFSFGIERKRGIYGYFRFR